MQPTALVKKRQAVMSARPYVYHSGEPLWSTLASTARDPAGLGASSIAILSTRLQLNLYPATVGAKQYEEELVCNGTPGMRALPTGLPDEGSPKIMEMRRKLNHS